MNNGTDIRKAMRAAKQSPKKQDGLKGVIYDQRGQYAFPRQVTKIQGDAYGTPITMAGVPYPMYGEDDLGYGQMMYPGMDYTFPGQYVTEYPVVAYGGDPSLPNIEGHYPFGGMYTKTHTHMKEGGWLNKYQKGGILGTPEQMYEDSLTLHNLSLKSDKLFKNVIEPLLKQGNIEKAWEIWGPIVRGVDKNGPAINKAYDRLAKINKKDPVGKDTPSKYNPSFGSIVFKKPVYNPSEKPVQPSMTKDKSGRPIGIIGQTYKVQPTPKEVVNADYLPMIQTGMPEVTMQEAELRIPAVAKQDTSNMRIVWRQDPTTKKMVPVIGERDQPVSQAKRIYNKNIPTSTSGIPEDFVPEYEPRVSFEMGGWLDELDELDEEYRRGGSGPYTPYKLKKKSREQGTSKNIQSSINKIFARNYDIFGPSGRGFYNPNSKYQEGGWLDQYQNAGTTGVKKPNILSAKELASTQPGQKISKEDQMAMLAMQAATERQPDMLRTAEKQGLGSKAWEILMNPMTAATNLYQKGYLPDNFSQGPTNPLDIAPQFVNPAFYAEAIYNTGKAAFNPQTYKDLGNTAIAAGKLAFDQPVSDEEKIASLNTLGTVFDASMAKGASKIVKKALNKKLEKTVNDVRKGMAEQMANASNTPKQLPGSGNVGKSIVDYLTTQTPLKNAYKLRSSVLKENPEMFLYRARPVGQNVDMNMAAQLRTKEAAGEPLTWYQKNLLNPQTNPQILAREKYYGQWFEKDPSRLDFYIDPGTRNFADNDVIELLRTKLPKSEAAKLNVSQFDDAKILSGSPETEFILPKNMVESAERFPESSWKQLVEEDKTFNTPHWWRGYGSNTPKQLPGSGNKFASEIDWGKWNPDTPKYPELINEYNAIEEATKANGTWMKNPDGSAFQGTPEQFIQQQSSWFKKAFGDSKLVNPDGSPMFLYHGSAKKFDTFDPSKFQLGDAGYSGTGIYTTPSKVTADSYATSSAKFHSGDIEPTVYQLYGQGNRPIKSSDLIKENQGRDLFNFYRNKNWQGELSPYESLREYDVAVSDQLPNVQNIRPLHDAREIVFPTNKQLKSAVGNVGFFDMTNPNIYKGLVPPAAIIGAAALQEKKYGGQKGWLDNLD